MGVLDAKIAVSFHGIDLTEHIRRGGTSVYDKLLESGDLLLPISNFFRERLLKLGFSPRRTLVHHVGVDVDKFRFKPRTSAKDEVVRVLTVGRLVPKKGVDYALRAIGSLKKRGALNGFHYDIVGDGPEREALVKLTDKLELGKHVSFHGAQSHQQIAEWMQKSHILLAPSVTASNGDMEGIPTTIMEAMASGMPVVSTRHSGIAELVDDGVTGMLCPERDFEKIADALRFLQQNRELWAEFGKAGRKVVEQDFNIARQNDRLARLYRDLAGLQAPTKLKRAV
jgi:colanic acid/amylovoran biosynthesis glycosyltransferase